MAKINYGKRTLGGLGTKISAELIASTQSSSEFRSEISKVFQRANRRIQNIERAGIFSPAVESLGELNTGYSKFSMGKNLTWAELKTQYGKAVAFLNQPTSTLSGTREFNEHLRSTIGIPKDNYNAMARTLYQKLHSMQGTKFFEMQLGGYGEIQSTYEKELEDAASLMEQEAVEAAEELQYQIDKQAAEIGGTIEDGVTTILLDD